jgi:hypothetical protein
MLDCDENKWMARFLAGVWKKGGDRDNMKMHVELDKEDVRCGLLSCPETTFTRAKND